MNRSNIFLRAGTTTGLDTGARQMTQHKSHESARRPPQRMKTMKTIQTCRARRASSPPHQGLYAGPSTVLHQQVAKKYPASSGSARTKRSG
ncbi:unnamed protein product [Pieris macdunnoughi]|uniref:Uncharacterized protein n=1 Tax=Pieris macdunnoughi TaxID=345717 RepID=A0A821LXX0_9NEOP|nr:unnamed protein product [Pieris macdunnoughi]